MSEDLDKLSQNVDSINKILSDNFNPEKQKELFLLKFFGTGCKDLMLERDRVILILLQVLLGFTVIATFFDNKLIQSNYYNYVIFLIVFIIFLIPIMLFDFSFKIAAGVESFSNIAKLKFGVDKDLFKKVIDGSVYVYLIISLLLFAIINWLIINNLCYATILFLTQVIIIGYLFFHNKSNILKK